MTFDSFERSNYSGMPTILYEFSLGSTAWRYCAADNDLSFDGHTYLATSIKNDGFSFSGNPETDDIQISIASSAAVTTLYVGTPPSDQVRLKIRTLHKGDTQAPVLWSGLVKSGKQQSLAEFVFTCNSLLSTLNRLGLRLSYSRGCPHALYDRGCKVDPANFATTVQLSAVNGNRLVSTGIALLPDGHLSGGFVSFQGTHGATDRRAIESHSGNTVTLLGSSDGISSGAWVVVYPGCDRVTSTCETKFNNLANYGGFPHLPTKSPFDGDPVF